jgi:hypothetical protein
MSVLKKIQFADAPMIGNADAAIIGAGMADCQNPIFCAHPVSRTSACYTAAH